MVVLVMAVISNLTVICGTSTLVKINSIANSDTTALVSSKGVTSSFSLVFSPIVLDRLIYKMFVVLDGIYEVLIEKIF